MTRVALEELNRVWLDLGEGFQFFLQPVMEQAPIGHRVSCNMSLNQPAHLEPSELGTKEYWDKFYTTDLSTPPSPLDGWFSDVNAGSKILSFLKTLDLGPDPEMASFLDLGTGNGEMLFRLREEGGFDGPMLGVDYSAPSVELARKLAIAKGLQGIEFEHWNIMQDPQPKEWQDRFDIVLDKGTFDAVSLSDQTDERGRRLCEGYRERVEQLVKVNGCFLVTSCNWTKAELVKWFTSPVFDGYSLEVCSEVSYPTFSFGGHTGQSISTLCFKKTFRP